MNRPTVWSWLPERQTCHRICVCCDLMAPGLCLFGSHSLSGSHAVCLSVCTVERFMGNKSLWQRVKSIIVYRLRLSEVSAVLQKWHPGFIYKTTWLLIEAEALSIFSAVSVLPVFPYEAWICDVVEQILYVFFWFNCKYLPWVHNCAALLECC